MQFEKIGTFLITKEQFNRFKSGELWAQWSAAHPDLFDSDDIRVAKSQAHLGYHFHEWLAALLIYQSTGYLSLIESYEYKIQERKQAILQKLLPQAVQDAIREITASQKVQCPDLLCYTPDLTDWYFCEVKGPKDKMRPVQQEYFERLVRAGNRPIRLIEFTSKPWHSASAISTLAEKQ